ncbi:hypothetical protein QWZ10_24580 [Paracoccus cavernae]|uniref:DNA-binding response regulator n=1 Tax=Paracoccus cavernae TaxID=1571207 RepID=A0ABT8DBK9_9RHOB|nr:hypothetical protein [Paracoccus cavernae]MDN3714178.1 hypothetical protein [Paracoccus cavernae]
MIYLVDDDEAVRNALALLLATYGKEVATFPMPRIFSPMSGATNRGS